MATRRALVLAGGGARGAFQVGMLRELVIGQGLDFQILRGVSVGALNAAFLAQAPVHADPNTSHANLKAQVRALQRLWKKEIEGDGSIYRERGGLPGLALGVDSLYSLGPLKRLLRTHLDAEKMAASGRDFSVGTVSLLSGSFAEWQPRDPDTGRAADRFLDRVLASASIPVVFPFVDFPADNDGDGDVLVDGGARNITPLSSAFDAAPDEIYVLLTSKVLKRQLDDANAGAVKAMQYDDWDDNVFGTKVKGTDVLTRTVDILSDEIYLEDLRGALDWNEAVASIDALSDALDAEPALRPATRKALLDARRAVRKRHVPINVLAPRRWYGHDKDNSATNFSPADIAEAISHGREIAANPGKWLVRA